MKESQIEKGLKEYANDLGWKFWKFVSPANRGVPDRIVFKKGIVFFFELKAPGKKLTPLQNVKKKILEDNFLPVYKVDSIEQGIEIINKYEDEIDYDKN